MTASRWEVIERFGIEWPEQIVHAELDEQTARALIDSEAPLSVVDHTGKSPPSSRGRMKRPRSAILPA